MDKQHIVEHIHRIEEEQQEQLLQTAAPEPTTTALVPVSQGQTPPIVESTIVIQDPPLPEDEAIFDRQTPRKRRVSFLLLIFTFILLFSIGMYFLLPLLFPSATVTIMPMEKRLNTTATIQISAPQMQAAANQIPGRLLPSLTLSQAATVKTTGIGHQSATYAYGTITLYNGLLISQVIRSGTIFTGRDGVEVITDQTATIAAATPPYEGAVTISAHAILPGRAGNIGAFDINAAFSSSILAKNVQPFYGGKDARVYPMVSQADIDTAVSHLKPSLTQSMQGALTSQLLTGEALITPTCVLKTKADHNAGEEASQVQVSLSQTCQAAAYQQADLQQVVTLLVDQEALQLYGSGYALAGDVSITLTNAAITSTSQQIATVRVNALSRWVYQLGVAERQQIEKQIAGKSKQQALSMLSHLDGIRAVTLNLVGGVSDLLPQDAGRIQVIVIYRFV